MSKTLGSQTRVRFDRRDRLNPAATEKDLSAIVTAVPELRVAYSDAVDGGVWSARTDTNSRGKGFDDLLPTESAAFSPTRTQLRDAARQAGDLIAEARALLQLAGDTLHRAQLRQDPEVLARDVEKRAAATQQRG